MSELILTTGGPEGIRRRQIEKEQLDSELQSWFASSEEDTFFIIEHS